MPDPTKDKGFSQSKWNLHGKDKLVRDFYKKYLDTDVSQDDLIGAYRKYGKDADSLVRGLYQDYAPDKLTDDQVGWAKKHYNLNQDKETVVDTQLSSILFPEDYGKTKNELPEAKYQKLNKQIAETTLSGVEKTLDDMGIRKGEDKNTVQYIYNDLKEQYQKKGGSNPFAIQYRWKQGVNALAEQYKPLIQQADTEEKQDQLIKEFNNKRSQLEKKLGITRKDGRIEGPIPGKDTFRNYLNNSIKKIIDNTYDKKGWGIPPIYTDEKAQEIRKQQQARIENIKQNIDQGIERNQEFVEQNKNYLDEGALFRAGAGVGAYSEQEKEMREKLRQRQATLSNLKTARSFLDSPTKESFDAFVEGLKATPFKKDVLSAGLNKMGRDLEKMGVSKKIKEGKELTEAEKALASSHAVLSDIEQGKDIPVSFDVGRQLAAMVPWLEQFALLRPIGTAVSLGTRGAIGATSLAGKVGAKAAGWVAGATAQSFAMPMLYSEYGLQRAGAITKDGDQFEIIGETKPGKAALKAVGNTVAEVMGEELGAVLLGSNRVQRFVRKLVRKPKVATNALRKQFNKVGYQGVPMEMLEEEFTGLIQSPINNDWSFFTGRQQLTTALTIAGMGAGMGAVNLSSRGATRAQRKIYENRIHRNFEKAESDLIARFEEDEPVQVIKSLGEEIESGNLGQLNEALGVIQDSYQPTRPQKEATINYLIRKAQVDGLNKWQEAQQKATEKEKEVEEGVTPSEEIKATQEPEMAPKKETIQERREQEEISVGKVDPMTGERPTVSLEEAEQMAWRDFRDQVAEATEQPNERKKIQDYAKKARQNTKQTYSEIIDEVNKKFNLPKDIKESLIGKTVDQINEKYDKQLREQQKETEVEDAERDKSAQVRREADETRKEQVISDSDMPRPDRTELQDREIAEERGQQAQKEKIEETVSKPTQAFAVRQGFDNIHHAVNSVKKNVRSDATAQNITQEDIQKAAQQSETVKKKMQPSFENVADANLKSQIVSSIEGLSKGQNPDGIAKAFTKVQNRLSKEDQNDITSQLKQKQTEFRQAQAQLEKESLEAISKSKIEPGSQKAVKRINEGGVTKMSPQEFGIGAMKSGENFDVIWDDFMGTVSAELETGNTLTGAIDEATKNVKDKAWWKKVKDKDNFKKRVNEHLTQELFDPEIASSDIKRLQKLAAKKPKNKLKDIRDKVVAYGSAVVSQSRDNITKREAKSILSAVKKANTYESLNKQMVKMLDVLEGIRTRQEQAKLDKVRKKLNKKALRDVNNPFSSIQESVLSFTSIKPKLIADFGEIYEEYKNYLGSMAQTNPALPKDKTLKDFASFVTRMQQEIDNKINEPLVDEGTKQEAYDYLNTLDLNELSNDELIQQLEQQLNISSDQAKTLVTSFKRKTAIQEKKLSNTDVIANKVHGWEREGLSEKDIISNLKEEYEIDDATANEKLAQARELKQQELDNTKASRDATVFQTEDFEQDQLDIVEELTKFTDNNLSNFSVRELRTLQNVYDNISKGWLSGIAYKRFIIPTRSVNTANKIGKHFNAKTKKRREKLEKALGARKGAWGAMIGELYKIDEALRTVGNKPLYQELVSPLSRALEKGKRFVSLIEEASGITKRVRSSRPGKKSLFDSTVFMEMYFRQREANANGLDGDFISKLIESTEKHYNEHADRLDDNEIDRIKQLYDKLPKKGEAIDMNGFFNNVLTKAERDFVEFHDRVISSDLSGKISHTQRYIRGGVYENIPFYAKRLALADMDNIDASRVLIDQTTGSYVPNRPSARAGSSYKRIAQAPAIHFDAVGNLYAGIKDAYHDYYVTPALMETFSTLEEVARQKEKGSESQILVKDIRNLFRDIIRNTYLGSKTGLTDVEKLIRTMERQAYMSVLGSIRRPAAEYTSNLFTVMFYDPGALIEGNKHSHDDFTDLMEFTGSRQKDRMGRDTQDLQDTNYNEDFIDKKLKVSTAGKLANFSQFNPMSKFKYKLGKFFITSADMAISHPFWKGVFARKFRKDTGEEFDIKKFRTEGNYRKKFKKALEDASDEADYQTSIIVNTTSPFESIVSLSNMDPKDRRRLRNQINSFVWKFAHNEYSSGVKAIRGLAGRNELSFRQAGGLLLGLISRQVIYNTAMQSLYLMGGALASGDWENWEDYWKRKYTWEGILRDTLGGFLTLGVGRWGNIARTGVAVGMELANQFVTNKIRANPYNSFYDSLMFNPVGENLAEAKNITKAFGAWGYYLYPIFNTIEAFQGYETIEEKGLKAFETATAAMDALVGLPDHKDMAMVIRGMERQMNPYFSALNVINQAEDAGRDITWVHKELKKVKNLNYEDRNQTQFLKRYMGAKHLRQLYDQEVINREAFNKFSINQIMRNDLNNKEKAKYFAKLEKEISSQQINAIIEQLSHSFYLPERGNSKYRVISDDLLKEIQKARK